MKWTKLGRIYATDTFAQCPTPLVMQDRVRVYFAERDAKNKSFIRYADFDLDDPTKMIGESGRVLENGDPGTFDDQGQIPSCAVCHDKTVNLYYSGWNTRTTVPYHNATGVATSLDGGETFERPWPGPLLDRTPLEPYLAVTPCWTGPNWYYVSGMRWEKIGDRMEPIYVICQATSKDGMHFERDGVIRIPQLHERECFSRPWVMKINDDWHMWYSHRHAEDYRDGHGAYRLGYAVSNDGQNWQRRDGEVGISVSEDGWDSKMIAYSAVFFLRDKLWMLYNGSSFGKHGFGLAVGDAV